MQTLLDGLVPGLPPTGKRGILSRAGGVPLYAVETVRMLVHEGRLELNDGVYRPTGDLSTIAVPDTLQALISARLDALDPSDRALLQVAAVLGQAFPIGALAAVSGEDEAAIEARLRVLARREIVVLDRDPRSPERGQYGFVQALIREVAYSMLTKRERRARHIAAARYYESLGDEELAGILAGHYLDAYRASPTGPEGDAVAAQARLAMRAAADRAEALGSYDQARSYLEQALTVATDEREIAELQERIGYTAQDAGRTELAIVALGEAAERYGRLGDRTARARVIARDGTARLFTGMGAVTLLNAAVEEFADLADTPEGVALHLRLAQSLIFNEHPDEGLPMLERALARAEHLDLVPLIADALVSRTSGLIGAGRHREAGVTLRGARDLAETYGVTEQTLRSVSNIVFLEMSGDPRSGVRIAREGIDDARRLGRLLWWFGILGNGAQCAFRTGDWDWALAELAAAFEMGPEGSVLFELAECDMTIRAFRGEDVLAGIDALTAPVDTLADHQVDGLHRLTRARERFAAGDLAGAHRLAMDAASTSGFVEALALSTAAQSAIRAGDRDRLLVTARAVERSGTHGDAMNVDRAMLAAAVAAERDAGDAAAAFRDAIERYRALGLTLDRAIAQANYASLFPDAPDASIITADARAAFEALGATAMLSAMDAGWSTAATTAPTTASDVAVDDAAEPADPEPEAVPASSGTPA
jgi:tetratricopeptide (TPR) repeat protein